MVKFNILTYLTLVYAVLSFGMGLTSYVLWKSRQIPLLKLIAIHWLFHFFNFFTSTWSGMGDPEDVNQVLAVMIMFLFVKPFH